MNESFREKNCISIGSVFGIIIKDVEKEKEKLVNHIIMEQLSIEERKFYLEELPDIFKLRNDLSDYERMTIGLNSSDSKIEEVGEQNIEALEV